MKKLNIFQRFLGGRSVATIVASFTKMRSELDMLIEQADAGVKILEAEIEKSEDKRDEKIKKAKEQHEIVAAEKNAKRADLKAQVKEAKSWLKKIPKVD